MDTLLRILYRMVFVLASHLAFERFPDAPR